eukprot:maker-scaffold_5-snap-gene-6.51-mRNA-1 protein AED:0.00 eAED:0.00 QI:56/1/1/1/1/1/2/101/429
MECQSERPSVGEVFLVRVGDESDSEESAIPAEILDIQFSNNLCYVHFLGTDSRLDQWVQFSRFISSVSSHELRTKYAHLKQSSNQKLSLNHIEKVSNQVNKQKRKLSKIYTANEIPHQEQNSRVRSVNKVQMGDYFLRCWYQSVYHPEHSFDSKYATYFKADICGTDINIIDCVYVCERSFKFFFSPDAYEEYRRNSDFVNFEIKNSKQIYLEEKSSVLEKFDDLKSEKKFLEVSQIAGKNNQEFCGLLCRFSKLFIEHKSVNCDPNPFMFYVLSVKSETKRVIVGYFSKEIGSKNNLSCILIFPQFQKFGFGRFMISLSYEISKKQKFIGSPEKPLSDLGKKGYRSYWSFVLLKLLSSGVMLNLDQISQRTSMKKEDILSTLDMLNFVKKAKNGIVLYVSRPLVIEKLKKYQEKKYELMCCREELLHI